MGRCPGGAAATTYASILYNTYGADEVWPLVDIAAGATINAYVNGNRDGTLAGWALQNTAGPVPGTLAPYSDGASGDWGDIYTSNGSDGLQDIFDPGEGSTLIWVKVANAGVWTDGAQRHYWTFLGSVAGNWMFAYRLGLANRTDWQLRGNSLTTASYHTPFSSTDWFSVGFSWSVINDQITAYINGAQVDQDTPMRIWSAATLDPNRTLIGASGKTFDIWHGWLAYFAVKFGSIWSPTDFQNMHNAAATAGPD